MTFFPLHASHNSSSFVIQLKWPLASLVWFRAYPLSPTATLSFSFTAFIMFYYKILWQINSKMALNYPCLYLVSRLSVATLAYTLWLKKQPCWEGPGSEVLGWSSDSSQQETEDHSLTWHKETNPANHHMSLNVNCFPVQLSDETSMRLTPRLPPCERPWSTGPR